LHKRKEIVTESDQTTKKKTRRTIIRKADVILLCVFLLAVALLFARPFLMGSQKTEASDKTVNIRQDGKVVGTYPLNRDCEIDLDSSGRHNIIRIQNGTVCMEESSCKNQVCVDQGKISRVGQSIICLPNRVVVEITGNGNAAGEEDDGVDAVAQ
jgi:hypothetical protein